MKKRNIVLITATSAILAASLMGCGIARINPSNSDVADSSSSVETISETLQTITETETTAEAVAVSSDYFTDRDLTQEADLSNAVSLTVEDGKTITIDSAGVYLISGTASNASIIVEAGDEDKVQLVLDGVSMTNDSTPCIYVKSADKVFVTTTDSSSSLSVTGTFQADGDTNTDAVIFSKDDLVLNGVGTLTITSSDNAVTSKDDLKVTGGNYVISCSGSAFEAHDLIAVADGNISIEQCNDGLHAEDSDDDTTGAIYILDGEFKINAVDDGIHGTTTVQIDGGTFDISAAEGIEATQIQINDGTINIAASDDGINAASKSSALNVAIEFNGGYTTIVMGAGDTDAVDSNGDITINEGTLDISAQSPFDYDGTAQKNGGTIIVNGQETDSITNQFGGGMMGGQNEMPGGGMSGDQSGKPSGGMPSGGPKGGMPGGNTDGSF